MHECTEACYSTPEASSVLPHDVPALVGVCVCVCVCEVITFCSTSMCSSRHTLVCICCNPKASTESCLQDVAALVEVCVAALRHSPALPHVLAPLVATQRAWPAPEAPWTHPRNQGWLQYMLPILTTSLLEAHPPASAKVRVVHAGGLSQ
jgi:hypothetical protein